MVVDSVGNQNNVTSRRKRMLKSVFGSNHREWLRVHHAADWITVIVIVIIAGICALVVPPYNRYLPQEDPTTTYPLKSDIVPNYALFITTIAGPPIIFLIVNLVWTRSKHDFHHATLGVYTAWAYTFALTTAVKLATGSYRPNADAQENNHGSSDFKQSFPSGHASLSFATMVFISLYFTGKFKVFAVHSGSLVLKGVLILSPLYLAMFIAISRTMDYHHSFADIIAGSLLGAGIGLFCYYLFYPLSFDLNCDKPRIHEHEERYHPDVKNNNSNLNSKSIETRSSPLASSTSANNPILPM